MVFLTNSPRTSGQFILQFHQLVMRLVVVAAALILTAPHCAVSDVTRNKKFFNMFRNSVQHNSPLPDASSSLDSTAALYPEEEGEEEELASPLSEACGESPSPSKIPSSMELDGDLLWTESGDRLFSLLSRSHYNRYQAPGQLIGRVTTVHVAFYIESMSTFRSQSMDYEVDMYLAYSWIDHRLAHNLSHPILITDLRLADKMWTPDLYFVNSKFAFMHEVTTPNFMMLVYKDGLVFKSLRINIVFSCLLKLHYFPMDQQECSTFIQSFAYVQNVLNLTWHVDEANGFPISYKQDLEKGLNDMDLIDRSWNRCDFVYPMFRGKGQWSCLKGTIIMKRKLHFHVIQIFIPTAMLVCISWLSFWLDVRASPARVSLTITTLLTLTTMSNGSRQDLPQVSYMKCIDRWIAACQAFVFSVLLEFTLVNVALGKDVTRCTAHMQQFAAAAATDNSDRVRDRTGSSVHKEPTCNDRRPFLKPRPCPTCSLTWENRAKMIDNISRILFPVCFVMFTVGYVATYSPQLQHYSSSS